jgi:hypothetical protein
LQLHLSSGLSTTTASVVNNIAAVLTAFSSETLITFAGSMIQTFFKLVNSPVLASNPKSISFDSLIFSTTQSHLKPALSAICFNGY